MDAILQIEFTPSFATGLVSPSTPQYAGTQGDKNAAYVCFFVPLELCGENYRYHIECIDGCGAQIVSQPLPIDSNHKVGMLLGQDITAAGGQALLRLVVTYTTDTADVTVARSFEGRVYFIDAVIPSEEEIHAATWRNVLRNLQDGASSGSVRGIGAAKASEPIGSHAVALGDGSAAAGAAALAAGYHTCAAGNYSTASGANTQANGIAAHSEGIGTQANTYAHAEGAYTRAVGEAAHAEGGNTDAEGNRAHAEGLYALAQGNESHAEGYFTVATGDAAHAEGGMTRAEGSYCHAAGYGTIANGQAQTAVGRYNAADPEALFVVGNGDDEHRHNAFTVKADGRVLLGNTLLDAASAAAAQAALEGFSPITIRWDEDGAGRDSFSLDDHPDMYQSRFFKVSDELPTMGQVIGGTYTHKDEYDVGTVTRQITADMVHQEQNCLLIDNSIIVVYDTDVDIGGTAVTAPSTGIYFADFFYGAYYAVTELTYGTKTVKEYVDEKVADPLKAMAQAMAGATTIAQIREAAQAFLDSTVSE